MHFIKIVWFLVCLVSIQNPCYSEDLPAENLSDSSKITFSGNFYYHKKEYGSEAQYCPGSVILNRGFEMLRISTGQIHNDPWNYQYGFKNVFDNLAHPFRNVSDYGTWNFFREQVIPMAAPQKPYWFPNYTLHLMGGGVTYVGLSEWFEAHNIPYGKTFSVLTVAGCALINEAIEERQRSGRFYLNVDAIADVYLFDLAGVLLFNSKKINRFFSHTLNVRDWSKQPSFTFPNFYLANCGQFFSLKWKLPFLKNMYYFQLVGLGGMVGLSYRFNGGTAISAGIGRGPRKKEEELFGLPMNISLVPMAGIYYDRDNALLASLEFSNTDKNIYHNYFCSLNIYPGFILSSRKVSPSLWLILDRQYQVSFGIGANYSLGFGLGTR